MVRVALFAIAILANVFGATAFFGLIVHAAGDEGETSNPDGPSNRDAEPQLALSRWDKMHVSSGILQTHSSRPLPGRVRSFLANNIPLITEVAAHVDKRSEPISMLGHRLQQLQRDHSSLEYHELRERQKVFLLGKLQNVLQDLHEEKRAVFLGPTPDRQGKYVAFPIQNPELSEFLLDPQKQERTAWAILGVWHGKQLALGKLRWYAYVSHHEPDDKVLKAALRASPDVKSLKHFLKHPL